MKKLKVMCPSCDKIVLKVASCRDLTLNCECGQEFFINATEESAVIKIRAPLKQVRSKENQDRKAN